MCINFLAAWLTVNVEGLMVSEWCFRDSSIDIQCSFISIDWIEYLVAMQWFLKNKNQLDATYYFIVFLTGSTCFGHYYAHHQELATIMLIESCFSLQPGHYCKLTTPNLQPTANQERNDQRGNQHYSRELMMMGIVVPETCWAYKKHNKIISGI